MSQQVFLESADYTPALMVWSGDWNGYSSRVLVMPIEEHERKLDAGRFTMMATHPCEFSVKYPKTDIGVFDVALCTEAIINWCHHSCCGLWHIKLTKDDTSSPYAGHDIHVTFASQQDADYYAVMLKLDSKMMDPIL